MADATWLGDDQIDSARHDAYDQAFLSRNPDPRGRPVQDMTGSAQRLGLDRPGNWKVYEFGYPRSASDPAREGLPEYTGARLAFCAGPAREDPGTPDFPAPGGQWGTACLTGDGSSGGPRIAAFDPATGLGTVVGTDTRSAFLTPGGESCDGSDATAFCDCYLVGPHFTTAITEPLYAAAQQVS